MKIFITGSHGFVGSRLIQDITKRFKNAELCEYDLAYGQDIRNKFQLSKEMELFQPDIVIHLAALAGVRRGEQFPDEYYSTNILGTENVFACAKEQKVKKVISFSSSSVLGTQGFPISVYGISKSAGEMIAKKYSAGVKYTSDPLQQVYVVRPYTVYGENGRNDQVIRRWINQILKGENITFYGTGTSFRPYTYVGDLVDAVCKMVTSDQMGYTEFDISGKEKISLTDLYAIFQDFCKSRGIYMTIEYMQQPDVDPMGNEVSTGKAFDILGWEPKTEFRSKLKSILKQELYKPWKQNQ